MATRDLIDELRRLEREATPGEWHSRPEEYAEPEGLQWISGGRPFMVDGKQHCGEGPEVCVGATAANATLVCGMRNALPALLTRLEALERVAREALYLRASGYDGPFMGEEIAPLFNAMTALERLDRVRTDKESK